MRGIEPGSNPFRTKKHPYGCFFGGPEGIRTLDPLLAKQVL